MVLYNSGVMQKKTIMQFHRERIVYYLDIISANFVPLYFWTH